MIPEEDSTFAGLCNGFKISNLSPFNGKLSKRYDKEPTKRRKKVSSQKMRLSPRCVTSPAGGYNYKSRFRGLCKYLPFSFPLSPSTLLLFSIFSQSLFPHFLRRTNGRGKSRKSKSGNGSRGKSQLLSQRRRKAAAVKKCSTVSLSSYQVEESEG